MIKRPAAAFSSSIEMLGQRIGWNRRIDAIFSRLAHTLSKTPQSRHCLETDVPGPVVTSDNANDDQRKFRNGEIMSDQPPAAAEATYAGEARPSPVQEAGACDTDLSDDMLKLVQYKILFIKRDYEAVFPEREEFVPDNLSRSAYIAWKIAEFIQNLDEIERPGQWSENNYPPGVKGNTIRRLPEDDKKYLQVYYKVLARYTRGKYRYEKNQIKALKQIRNAIKSR